MLLFNASPVTKNGTGFKGCKIKWKMEVIYRVEYGNIFMDKIWPAQGVSGIKGIAVKLYITNARKMEFAHKTCSRVPL